MEVKLIQFQGEEKDVGGLGKNSRLGVKDRHQTGSEQKEKAEQREELFKSTHGEQKAPSITELTGF